MTETMIYLPQISSFWKQEDSKGTLESYESNGFGELIYMILAAWSETHHQLALFYHKNT